MRHGDGTVPALAGSRIEGMFDELGTILAGIAFAALVVAIIIIGFKIMFALRSGDSVREAIQNMGLIAIAALVIAGASGIATALRGIGNAIAGN